MNKLLRYFIFFIILLPVSARAQFSSFRDSVVQLYGVVMTADSLQALQGVSIMIKGQNRGTVTNSQGVFSIVALKGDMIEFTSVGFKPKKVEIPQDLVGNQHSIIQLMVNDTIYLAATIIKPKPTREQFERDFLATQLPDDNLEVARKNNDANTRRLLMATLPKDGQEAASAYLSKQAAKNYYTGQIPPQNLFNPLAWADFIKAWKRGDFKSK